jgi:hypothetical protein
MVQFLSPKRLVSSKLHAWGNSSLDAGQQAFFRQLC